MVGSISALLASLFPLYLAWDIWDSSFDPLLRYGGMNLMTWYGLGVVGQFAVRIVVGIVLLWLFVRLGGSKPLPRLRLARS
jgi:hypothetical protein